MLHPGTPANRSFAGGGALAICLAFVRRPFGLSHFSRSRFGAHIFVDDERRIMWALDRSPSASDWERFPFSVRRAALTGRDSTFVSSCLAAPSHVLLARHNLSGKMPASLSLPPVGRTSASSKQIFGKISPVRTKACQDFGPAQSVDLHSFWKGR